MRGNHILEDYAAFKRQAVYWARIALDSKRQGLPSELAARNAYAALRWALLVIR